MDWPKGHFLKEKAVALTLFLQMCPHRLYSHELRANVINVMITARQKSLDLSQSPLTQIFIKFYNKTRKLNMCHFD